MMKPTSGVTLVELLIALLLFSLAIFSLLTLSQASHQTTLDAYFEFLGLQLAKEPLQVFRARGYDALKTYAQSPLPDYPLFEWKPIQQVENPDAYPGEARLFTRHISLTQETVEVMPGAPVHAFKVTVVVAPARQSWLDRWLTRDQISLESLIVEQ